MIQGSKTREQETTCQLSICIATRNRCDLLMATLRSALAYVGSEIEVVVVDGASTDHTKAAVSQLAALDSRVRYFYEASNGGIDRDYDKSVAYARGRYCWLMSDDDWFLPGAISRVLDVITSEDVSVIVANAEMRDVTQKSVLLDSWLLNPSSETSRFFSAEQLEDFFRFVASRLSYIGAVVIRRDLWNFRDRDSYFGSNFVHVGVIFQSKLPQGARILFEPCVAIRFGNASWNARSFEIWAIRWPKIIWSFPLISDLAKKRVVSRAPFASIKQLFIFRAKAEYDLGQYNKWIADTELPHLSKMAAFLIAVFPGVLANLLSILFVKIFSQEKIFASANLRTSPFYPFQAIK